MPGAPIEVINLTKYYGSFRAVDAISFRVNAGEFLALLGPSGSGKTTILMTIAGLTLPTGGEILIGNRKITRLPPDLRDIGVVFQRYALFPHMSVWDNIAFPLRMRRLPRRETAIRVDQALQMVQLEGFSRRFPQQLSGGQQQRVALARAIVYAPPVLLMDEPLGALDKKLRTQMQLEIRHLQRQLGATVIYVTHDQEEALTVADRIAVLRDGRLEQLDTPQGLYKRPANEFVADFVGETNFLVGKLLDCANGIGNVELWSGVNVRASSPFGAGAAQADVRVAVRPERVVVRAIRGGEEGRLVGMIEELIFGGPSTACMIRLPSGLIIVSLMLATADDAEYHVGDRVAVEWRAEDAQIFFKSPLNGSNWPGPERGGAAEDE